MAKENDTQPQNEASAPAPSLPEQSPPPAPGKAEADKNAVEKLYDKIPLTYKQVDLIVKVLVGILILLLIVGIATGTRLGGGG